MIKQTTLLLLLNTLVFYVLITFIFSINEFQYASIFAEIFTLLIGLLLFYKINSKRVNVAFEIPLYLIFFIIIVNAVIGIINLDFIFSQINFNELNEQTGFDVSKISKITGSSSIFISQTGGFFIQAFLTFFLIQIMDININTSDVFKILGVAYLGFLIISLLTFIYNIFF